MFSKSRCPSGVLGLQLLKPKPEQRRKRRRRLQADAADCRTSLDQVPQCLYCLCLYDPLRNVDPNIQTTWWTLLNLTQHYSTLLNITQHYSTPLSGHKATFRCKEATRTAHNSQSQPPSRRQQEDTTGYRRIKRQVRDGERLLSRFGQNEVEHLYISTSTMYLLRLSTTWLYDIVWVLIWI